MTISFHRRGEDEERDKAFDDLREALDELKEMEGKEFGNPEEMIEEKDSAALVEAQSRDEEGAFVREQEEGEEADTEALRKADERAMNPAD